MPINIRGKEYKTVAERGAEAHQKYGNRLSIFTEIDRIIETEGKPKEVVVKATVEIRGEEDSSIVQRFVDYAHEVEETRNTKAVNFTSWMENCCTSAIGRALAAAGFAGSEYASADELQKALEKQASFASEGQIKSFGTWLRKHFDAEGKDKERVQAALRTAGIVQGKPSTQAAIIACMTILTEEGNGKSE